MTGLWVVGGADDVAAAIVAEDFGVLRLRASGHGLTDPGECLMAVQAVQLDDLAVEREAMVGEHGFSEANAAGVFVDGRAVFQELNVDGVELGVLEIPEVDFAGERD